MRRTYASKRVPVTRQSRLEVVTVNGVKRTIRVPSKRAVNALREFSKTGRAPAGRPVDHAANACTA